MAAAIVNGDELQPFSAPWCSSSDTNPPPSSSSTSTMSSMAL